MSDYYRQQLSHFVVQNSGIVATAAAVAASASFYWLTSSKVKAIKGEVDLKQQSVDLGNGVRCSAYKPDGSLMESYYDDAKTTFESFNRGLRVSNNGPCLGTRSGPNLEYVWQSYQEIYDKARLFGSALITQGLKPGQETFVGIFAMNRPEWVISDLSTAMFSMVYVPLYDTLGTEAVTYIINQTSMSAVTCDTVIKAETMLKNAKDTPSLRTLIVWEDVPNELRELGKANGVNIFNLTEFYAIGMKNLQDPVPPKPTDLVTVCYTSGTTGNPKGVMLTHASLIANVDSVNLFTKFDHNDVHISYLPLAHMFERIVQVLIIQHGARIGFSRGDVKFLTEDLMALRPTIFPTVPRLLNRIYDKVLAGVSGSKIKTFMFNLAYSRKMALLKQGIQTKDSVWDRLVFNKVQKLLGGRVRFCIVGSAPLAGKVLDFTRVAFGCLVCEGYGQTEATAGICITLPHEHVSGQVGPPLPCNHVKLIDVPEMDYYAKDGRGEVCAKGTNIMQGYYKDEAKTKETIDEDGWVHTGDVGEWTPQGTLRIIDRRKHIFKLAQGEYLAPEKIEGIYTRSSLVAQAFVDGNSLQSFPVAIIIPDPEVILGWAKDKGLSGSMEELCGNKTVIEAIHNDILAEGKKAGLKGFEQVKRITLHSELFSVENDLLTPTFKSKRASLRKFFHDEIEDMYNQN